MNNADSPVFLLDTSVLTQAARGYYAFDIAPSFWEQMRTKSQEQEIIIIDRVLNELERGKDKLCEWAKDHLAPIAVKTDNEEVIVEYSRIMQWAQGNRQFTDGAREELADVKNADGWLVAYAMSRQPNRQVVIVTMEVFDAGIKSKIKIPNICRAFSIDYIDTYQMMRQLNIRF